MTNFVCWFQLEEQDIVLSKVCTFLALIVTPAVTFYQYEVSIILFYFLGLEGDEESRTEGMLLNAFL